MLQSVDLGFGAVKGVSIVRREGEEVRHRVDFPSVVRSRLSRNGLSSFLGNKEDYEVDIVDAETVIDLSGSVEGIEYYSVGESAITNGGRRTWTDAGTFDEDSLRVLLTTASALLMPEASDIGEIDLLVGLPIAYMLDKKVGKRLIELIKNIDVMVNVNGEQRHVKYNKVTVYPQGVGGYFDVILGWDGRVANESLAEASVGIINIGYRTLEYLVVRIGLNGIQFIDDLSGSLDKQGMNEFYGLIQDRIDSKNKVKASIEDIERALLHRDGNLETSKGLINIKGLADEADLIYFKAIATEVKRTWGVQEESLRHTFIDGGGAYRFVDGFKNAFSNVLLHGEETNSEDKLSALYANANGYIKMYMSELLNK